MPTPAGTLTGPSRCCPGSWAALITTTGQVARRRQARITGPAGASRARRVARRPEYQHVRARAPLKQDPRGEAVDDLHADLDVRSLVGLDRAHQVIDGVGGDSS